MIIALDTSTPRCVLSIWDGSSWNEHSWDAGRELAAGILTFLEDKAGSLEEITGIIAYKGPGSFTGLRIGLTVLNTIADARQISIVGVSGQDWLTLGLERLQSGDNDRIVMPLYGAEPNITTPRK